MSRLDWLKCLFPMVVRTVQAERIWQGGLGQRLLRLSNGFGVLVALYTKLAIIMYLKTMPMLCA